MEFLDLAKRRFSVRKFSDRKVEREKLDRILEAGRVAPTASNNQPQRVVVVETPEGLAKLAADGTNPYCAPLALLVCVNCQESFVNPSDGQDSCDVDAAIVATHMMLEAVDQGLGTIWIGQFDSRGVRRNFGLPEEIRPVCTLMIGYPDCEALSPDRHRTMRKPLGETVFYEKYPEL